MNSSDSTLERLEKAIRLGSKQCSTDFDLNPAQRPKGARKLRDAAVLIPLIHQNGSWNVVLTKRASALRHHPGQVAFPGGKLDEGDPSAEAAALREAHEEIGLDPQNVNVLGRINPHETVTNFNVTPILGHIKTPFTPIPEVGEVDTVFTTPLDHLMNPEKTRIEHRIWSGTKRQYYVIPYGPFYIWGATARIIVGLRTLWDAAA